MRLPRFLVFALLVSLAGCCKPDPVPEWVAAEHPRGQTVGQALNQSDEASALNAARRAAARKVVAGLAELKRPGRTAAQRRRLAEQLEREALTQGVLQQRYLVDCGPYEATVLVFFDLAALEESARRLGEEAPPLDVEEVLREGRDLLARARYAEAANRFERVTTAQPERPQPWRLLGDALRADYGREGVARAEGERDKLREKALRSYTQAREAASAANAAEELRLAEAGLAALREGEADLWRRKARALAERALRGKRPAGEVLQSLIRALEPQLDDEQRRYLQDQALEVEAFALVERLREALGGAQRVAVLLPAAGEDQREVAGRLAGRIVARLIDAQLEVRSPAECRVRGAKANLGEPRAELVYEADQRAKLRAALEVDAAVLIEVGQRVTATAYDLSLGAPRAPVARVFHPGPAVWREANWSEPDLVARVTFHGQRLDPARKLEQDLLVTDGVRLRDGDQLQCELRLDQPAHVYLLSYDSSGKLWRLFPETERLLPDAPPAAKNPLAKGAHWIPGREHFLILDETPGVETLYLVVARKPQPDLVALSKHVTTGEGDPTGALRRKLEGLAAQALSLAVESERNQGIALHGKDLLVRELRFTHVPR